MYELRDELVHIIVNDYIFVDEALIQLLKTPYDIQIVVPYHFAMDARPGTYEALLQKMWKDAARKKRIALRSIQLSNADLNAISDAETLEISNALKEEEKPEEGKTEEERTEGEEEVDEEEEEEEEEDSDEEEEVERYPKEYMNAVLIQRHIRYRQFYVKDFAAKCNYRRSYFARTNVIPPAPEMMYKAANLIHKFYRACMQAKRQHFLDHKRDVMLGLVPDVERRRLKFREENELLYERRRQTRQKLQVPYTKLMEREQARLVLLHKDAVMDSITKEIRDWFEDWYYGYGFFPQYPYESEGGTVLVMRGEFPTIAEQKDDDDLYRRTSKGKTKEMLREEAKQKKKDAEEKAKMEKFDKKKETLDYFLSRFNPITDFGYMVRKSKNMEPISEALRKYRQAWSVFDQWPLERCGEVIYGYMKPLLTEDLMQSMHLECRKIVDRMMRLELKLFIKVQKRLYNQYQKIWPLQRMRPRPKKEIVIPPFIVDNDMIKSVKHLFDMDIISKPTSKLDDIIGDLSYGAYEHNIEDANATFPSPGYADVKRRLVLSCVFGAGLEPGADRKKAVMLMGIPRNGKSFLVDCVAGEMNAVKFDISPEMFSSKIVRPMNMLKLVLTAARMFQPSVIFFKDIERVFLKIVPPKERKLKAAKMKTPLRKLIQKLPVTEKVIFIATCSEPFLAKVAPMMNMFDEVIVVPKPDYGSLQRFFYDRFQKIRSMPRDYCVQPLAKCLQGIGFGLIMQVYDTVMNPTRICTLNVTPLQQSEFVEYMIEHDIESIDEEDYQKMMDLWLKFSPLKKARADYAIINASRDAVYKKLAEINADKEASAVGIKK
ncbi:hypothetical protein O0L34_g12108 [Tuta absoluta]|nr:hypothetical protein O0L34_g12108 [Tuta absoluta]